MLQLAVRLAIQRRQAFLFSRLMRRSPFTPSEVEAR